MKDLPPGSIITNYGTELPPGAILHESQDTTLPPLMQEMIPQPDVPQNIQDYENAGGGFLNSVGRGIDRFKQTLAGQEITGSVNNARIAEAVGDTRKAAFERSLISPNITALRNIGEDIKQSPVHPDITKAYSAMETAIAELPEDAPWYDVAAKGAGAFGKTLLNSTDKTGAFVDLLGEQAPIMAGTILTSRGLGTLTSGLGRAGEMLNIAAGAGATSYASSYGTNLQNALDQGMSMDDAIKYAKTRSGVQAGVDAATGAVVPFKLGNKLTNIPAQLAVQAAGGSGGEYLSAESVGEKPNPSDVLAEGLLEGVGLPGEIAGVALGRRGGKESPETTKQHMDTYLALPTPEEQSRLGYNNEGNQNVIAMPNEQGGDTIYSPGNLKLPSPGAYQSDSEGNTQRLNEGDAAALDRARQVDRKAALGYDDGLGLPKTDAETLLKSVGQIEEMTPDEINVDARKFQFKGGDEQGVTERLAGVKEFDPGLAGVGLVYEDKNGKRYMVDGHQRLALAKRAIKAGQKDVTMPVRIIRETDGFTSQDAKNIAIEKYKAEQSGAMQNQAISLANLSDNNFKDVTRNNVSQEFASIVGNIAPDSQNQEAIIKAVKELKPKNNTQVEIIARDIANNNLARPETASSIFGSNLAENTLFRERAQILDSAIRTLQRDEAINRSIPNGNIRDSVIDLSTKIGELSNALTENARAFKRGEKPFVAARTDFTRRAREIIQQGATTGNFGISNGSQNEENTPAAEEARTREPDAKEKLDQIATEINNNPNSTLYSNAFFAPEIWQKLYNDVIRPLFGWSQEKANEWKKNWETTTSLYTQGKGQRWNPLEVVGHTMQLLFRSKDGFLASLAARYKSPTITAIRDMLFADPTTGRAIGRSYHEAVEQKTITNLNRLARILEPISNNKDDLGRIVFLIENPDKIVAGRSNIDNAAIAISRQLAEERQYMIGAGLEVGEVQEGGYFPAMYDSQAILNNESEFLKTATRAYQLTYSELTKAQAEEMANSWLYNIRLGDMFVNTRNNDFNNPVGGVPVPSSMKERVFNKKARDLLREDGFTITDTVTALQMHFMRTAAKAEFNRRFAPEKWTAMKESMLNEGAGEAIPHVVKLIKASTGNVGFDVHPIVRKLDSYAGLWSALEFLPRAAISSAHEAAMNAVTSGNFTSAIRAFADTFKGLYKSANLQDMREISEDIIGTTGDIAENMLMEQRLGGYTNNQFTRHLKQNFFKYTGLERLTEAQRVASLRAGQFLLAQLAADVAKRGNKFKSAQYFMRELGISSQEALSFADWINGFTNGRPGKADLMDGGQMQELYITALQRYVNRTIQNPNSSTRTYLAEFPLVRLAYNLQSFNYAFAKNVLLRNIRLLGEATKEGYTAADRFALVKPTLMLMVPFVLAGAIGELRDKIYEDPAKKDKKEEGWVILGKAASRAGLFGATDPLFNMITAAKYQKDPATILVGPLGGAISTLFKTAAVFGQSETNSDNTNTAERNLAKAVYNTAIQPILNGIASLSPIPLVGAVAIQGVSHPAIREEFITAVAGKKQLPGGANTGNRSSTRSPQRRSIQRKSQR